MLGFQSSAFQNSAFQNSVGASKKPWQRPWWEIPQKRIFDVVNPKTEEVVDVFAEVEDVVLEDVLEEIPQHIKTHIDTIAEDYKNDLYEEVSGKLSRALALQDITYEVKYLAYLQVRLQVMQDDEEAIMLLMM